MSRLALVVGVLVCYLAGGGCYESSRVASGQSSGQSASVVDLDAVARAMDRDTVIVQRIDQATRQLNDQLRKIAEDLNQQIAEVKATFGEQPTDEQRRTLEQLTLRANRQLQTNRLIAEARRQEVRQKLIAEFRAEIEPVARRIAKRRGSEVVLVANDSLVWFATAADITDEIISDLRAAARGELPSDSTAAEEPRAVDTASESPAEASSVTGSQPPSAESTTADPAIEGEADGQ